MVVLVSACNRGQPNTSPGGGPPAAPTSPMTGPIAAPPTGLCDDSNICWVHPLPQGADAESACVDQDGTAWTVGEQGTIVRWKSAMPALVSSGTRVDLHGIWGCAGGD